MKYAIRPIREGDIEHVASFMRQSDVHEVAASVGLSPMAALVSAVQESELAVAVCANDIPFAIWGCGSYADDESHGCPWLLCTDEWSKHRRYIVRCTPRCVAAFLRFFPKLSNYVDARHADSIRWLKWAGFTLHPAAPYGPFGMPFHLFTKAA